MDIQIKSNLLSTKVAVGDFISANGVSLKIKEKTRSEFMANVVKDIFEKSNLKYLSYGDQVNLERSLQSSNIKAENLIQGYVDTTGKIVSKNSNIFTVITYMDYSSYITKGKTITIDGSSVKIIDSRYSLFSFALTDFKTYTNVILNKDIGSIVNIEFDILGKYLKNMLTG